MARSASCVHPTRRFWRVVEQRSAGEVGGSHGQASRFLDSIFVLYTAGNEMGKFRGMAWAGRASRQNQDSRDYRISGFLGSRPYSYWRDSRYGEKRNWGGANPVNPDGFGLTRWVGSGRDGLGLSELVAAPRRSLEGAASSETCPKMTGVSGTLTLGRRDFAILTRKFAAPRPPASDIIA